MNNSDFKVIDGKQFIKGKVIVRFILAHAIVHSKSTQAQLFQSDVIPLIGRTNMALANEVAALITQLDEAEYRFKIRRGIDEVAINQFYLLDEADLERIDDLCQQIDEAVGSAAVIRAMKFHPANTDGSPIAS